MLELDMMNKGSMQTFRPAGTQTSTAIEEIAMVAGRQMAVYTIKYQAAAASRLGITLQDVKALDLMMTFEALATGHLAQLLGVSAGGATALINRLESAGLVVRDRHPLDRRIVVVRALMERCTPLTEERQAIQRDVAALARRYDMQEVESVHTFLHDLARVLRRNTLSWLNAHPGHSMDH